MLPFRLVFKLHNLPFARGHGWPADSEVTSSQTLYSHMGLSDFIHRNIHVDSPYEINRASDELHYTYLDTFGRPVIVAHKSNLVEQHIQDIVVSVASVHGLPEQLCLL